MYPEDELLPISALQHLVFCERQWAFIHLEQLWSENRLTAEGRILHNRVHQAESESRGDVRIARGLRLRCLRLGLSGVADVVEFHRVQNPPATSPAGASMRVAGVVLPGITGIWHPFPVEHKRGRPKPDGSDEVQLCAQALCLEEALNVQVPGGALFYGKPRRRHEVAFGEPLRRRTEYLAQRLHELTRARKTPPAVYEPKCDNCSLFNLCLPKTTDGRKSVRRYVAAAFKVIDAPNDGGAACDTC